MTGVLITSKRRVEPVTFTLDPPIPNLNLLGTDFASLFRSYPGDGTTVSTGITLPTEYSRVRVCDRQSLLV